MKRAALLLAVSTGVLGAPALYAQIIGQQSGILGGEEGFYRPSSRPLDPPPTAIAIDALPYARTLACGSYTLTGTSEGADEVTWSVSPGSASGTCSGTDTWSCVVAVSPTSAGEATPTITVTASSDGGDLTATTTVGFFPGTAYSCYLAQNVDGSYDATLTTLDAVATWQDSTSGNRDLTQGTGTAQPTFYEAIDSSNGQPLVYCDGGDLIAASTAADWTFLHAASTERTVIAGAASRLLTPATTGTIATNKTNTDAALGWRMLWTVSTAKAAQQVGNGSAGVLNTVTANNSNPGTTLGSWVDIIDDGTGDDGFLYINETLTQAAATGSLSASNGGALTLCNRTSTTGSAFTGWVSHVVTYQRVLTAGEIAAADAVVKWAFGSADVPVVLPVAHFDASVVGSFNKDGSDLVQYWYRPSQNEPMVILEDYTNLRLAQTTVANKPTYLSANGGGLDFDGTNDTISTGNQTTITATTGWVVAVVRVNSVGTNVTGASCLTGNDTILRSGLDSLGLLLREGGGVRYLIGATDDGAQKCAETVIDIDTDPHIFEWRFGGGNVCSAADGGTPTCVASGAITTGNIAINLGKGLTAGTNADITIHEVLVYPYVYDAERTRILDALQTKWGTP